MKKFLHLPLLLVLAAGAHAAVVRPAPNFGVEGAGKNLSLKSFRGQPVVLVVTHDAREKAFRWQVDKLRETYSQFASEKVVFIAAIENGPAEVRSNIPFAFAQNPAGVAADYGFTGKFGIVVIGKDGNVDLTTTRVIPASRVRDVIFSSFENQKAARSEPR